MIRSFKCKETEKIFNLEPSRKFPPSIQRVALRKLRMINQSISVEDLKVPPANRLEKLRGKLAEYYSIRINDQWRICFKWINNQAIDVYIVDYH